MLYAVCREQSTVPVRYTVGQYVVDLASFEAVVLPLLEDCLPPPPPVHSSQSPSPAPAQPSPATVRGVASGRDGDGSDSRREPPLPPAVLVIDEVGKMELFSARFEQSLRSLLDQSSQPMSEQSAVQPLLLGTVMERRPGCPPLVEQLQSGRWPAVEIVRVTRENRDQLRTSLTAKVLAFVLGPHSPH